MTTAVFLAPLSVAGGPLFIPGTVSPAAGGQLFTYITGSSTKLATYTTSSGSVANANPIVLDSGGFVTGSGEVWLIQSSSYRFILAPSTDTDPPASPYWTRDSISGINDVQTQINAGGQEWISASTTPVFGNASSFVISGDQRSTFTVGRRVKTTNTGGTVYGTITSSVFTTSTAVGLYVDSLGLDSGLSAVSYGLLSTPDGSVPFTQYTSSGTQSISTVTFFASSSAVWGSGTVNFGTSVKRKTANETISTATALHNDNTLFVPLKANEEWIIDYDVGFENALQSTGLQVGMSSPAGATSRINVFVTGNYSTAAVLQASGNSDGSFNFGPTVSSASTALVMLKYHIVNGANAGNAQFQWSQTTNTSTPLSARQGSSLKATRVA